LTEKAIAAAKKIKFTPAEKDGRPVSQYVTLEYNFHIIEDENKLKHKAVILEMPKAEYTEEARRFGIEGKVVLDVFLYNDGTISTSVVSGLPYGLTMQAIKAAHEIKFTPAENNGRTASVIRRIEFPFSLK
jgi:TonB family protein